MKYWLILDLSDHTYIFATSQNRSSQHYENQVPHLFPLRWDTENPWDSRFNSEYITEEQALTPLRVHLHLLTTNKSPLTFLY